MGPTTIATCRSTPLAGAAVGRLLFENSLSILNRTGAWHIAKDLCQEFVPEHAQARYWRLGPRVRLGEITRGRTTDTSRMLRYASLRIPTLPLPANG